MGSTVGVRVEAEVVWPCLPVRARLQRPATPLTPVWRISRRAASLRATRVRRRLKTRAMTQTGPMAAKKNKMTWLEAVIDMYLAASMHIAVKLQKLGLMKKKWKKQTTEVQLIGQVHLLHPRKIRPRIVHPAAYLTDWTPRMPRHSMLTALLFRTKHPIRHLMLMMPPTTAWSCLPTALSSTP